MFRSPLYFLHLDNFFVYCIMLKEWFSFQVFGQKVSIMKISKKDAVSLLCEGGFDGALQWTNRKLESKLNSLISLRDQLQDLSPENESLAKRICEALQEGEDIELEDEVEEEEEESDITSAQEVHANDNDETVKEAPRKRKKKSEGEEVNVVLFKKKSHPKGKVISPKQRKEEEDVKKALDKKKGVKPVKPPKPDDRKKPNGVIATIVNTLRKATEKRPVTKERILEVLVKKFPDRSPLKMMSTVSSQVPSGLRVGKSLEVHKNDKGYWLDPLEVDED